jgi:ATP:ADP antiporter, AAA family
MVLAPFVNYNMDAIFPFCAEAAQYDTLSDASLHFGNDFQSFFALYSLAVAITSILLQFLSGRVIEKFGIKKSFAFLPFSMLLASVINFLIPGVWGSAPVQGVTRVTLDTVDQSNRKAYQALVPDEKRGRVSIFIDSYLPSLGTILGSLLAFGIISWGLSKDMARETLSSIYLGVGIIAAIIAVIAFFLMHSTYDQSLLNWQMKRRSRGSSVMDLLDFSDEEDS